LCAAACVNNSDCVSGCCTFIPGTTDKACLPVTNCL
jgi:hypothetical protein